MKQSTFEILNNAQWKAHQADTLEQLRMLFDGEKAGPLLLSGWVGRDRSKADLYTDPEGALHADLDALAHVLETNQKPDRLLPLCVEGEFFGVHFIDRIFGAEVFFKYDQWYNRYLKNEVGQLTKPDLDTNETVLMSRRYAQAFLDANVSVPILGLPTIASALNIAINLYGEEILVAMLEEPEAAHHDLQIINEVLIELHQWYLDRFPLEQIQPVISWDRTQPAGYGQLCGCSTQLLSAQLYEEFILPLDDALLAVYPHGGMIHLCGDHRHLIPLFAKMPHLRSAQLNDRASEQLEDYVKGFREDQVIYLNPCEGMPAEKAREIAKDHKLIVVGAHL